MNWLKYLKKYKSPSTKESLFNKMVWMRMRWGKLMYCHISFWKTYIKYAKKRKK